MEMPFKRTCWKTPNIWCTCTGTSCLVIDTSDSVVKNLLISEEQENKKYKTHELIMTDTEANTSTNGKQEITAEDIKAAVKNIEQRKTNHPAYKALYLSELKSKIRYRNLSYIGIAGTVLFVIHLVAKHL